MRNKRAREAAERSRKIPESLGNRVCGVWPNAVVLFFDALVHIVLFVVYGQTLLSFFRLFFSFIFFIYPLYYLTDILWSLRPSVCGILSGKIAVNRKYYMNTARRDVFPETLFPVTVSIPVYTESNETIFETIRESLAAVLRYRAVSGREANVVVSDDGLAPMMGGRCTGEKAEHLLRMLQEDASVLTPQERKAAQRLRFYRERGIAFVARPAAGRAGLFKKASNLNYTLNLGSAVSAGSSAESLTREGAPFEGGYAEGDITTHEVILLLDKDSGVSERIIEAVLPEFTADEKLAYVQCATDAANLYENFFTYATGHQINNLFHVIWPCKALQGFFVPLVGHNVFLRKSILEKSGLWPENRVSEDYDKAINFYSMGYHGKYAQLKGMEFTEYASRTFAEETGKQRRYAYGLFEMMFDGTVVPGKTRGCDLFYMVLYFLSVINQVLLIPTVLLESYFGNIHLLWAGFLFCTLCFILASPMRGRLMRRYLSKEHSEQFVHTLLVALSFVGHSFSSLAGACRYLANKVRENRKPFPSTNVDRLGYRFADGVKLLVEYVRRNPWFPVLAFLCMDRGIYLLTKKGLETLSVVTYVYILFCAVFIPVLLTPQLFAGFRIKRAIFGNPEGRPLNHEVISNSGGARALSYCGCGRSMSATGAASAFRNGDRTGSDVERFLADYRKTLESSLPEEDLPEEILSGYSFESCLRKDPEGKKELYVLRHRSDHVKALLRITRDYPEEDALEEAKLLAVLDHPGIPKVYGSFEKDGRNYLIREYVEGRTLDEIVTAGGSLGANDIFGIALKLVDILSYLHAQTPPVIHRDIKPQNIITGQDGTIHLIDFGIARVHKEERRKDTAVVLTMDYASPEQYGFEQTTPLSDIYSLGVVMLFLATGKTGRSGPEAQIVNNRLRSLIGQCMAFNPKARIQSVEEIREFILHDNILSVSKRTQRFASVAALLAVVLCLSVISYGSGYAIEKGRAEKRGYTSGYGVGYTDGYEAASVFFRGAPEEKEIPIGGNSHGNLAAAGGAYAVQYGNLLFYIADGDICSMAANGAGTAILVRDGHAEALSCFNGWLYYTSGSRIMQTSIYTRKSDVLCAGRHGALYVEDGQFFIHSEDGLDRLDPETGQTSALNRLLSCRSLNLEGGHIFHISGTDRGLYRCSLTGENMKKLIDGTCRSVCLFSGALYCSVLQGNEGLLVKIDRSTGRVTRLLEGNMVMLNVTDSGVCFIDIEDGTINRCSFDGRYRERITGNHAADFNIAGDWIFYHNEGDGGRLWCVRLDGANDHPVPSGR